MRYWDAVEWSIVAIALLIIGGIVGGVYLWYEEYTYDYARCERTEVIQHQHRDAFTTVIYIGKTPVVQQRPEENWTDRLYICPEGNRWRKDEDVSN